MLTRRDWVNMAILPALKGNMMKKRYLVQVEIVGTCGRTGYRVGAFNHTDARRQVETIGRNRGTPFQVLGIYQLDTVAPRADETRFRLLTGARG